MVREREGSRTSAERERRLREAAEAVINEGISFRRAEQLFGVSKSAVQRVVKRMRASACGDERSDSGTSQDASQTSLSILVALCMAAAAK